MIILYILLALFVLLVMITIHEAGHYLAGKMLGFKINEFSIGFGPKLFQRKNKKTGEKFSIRALPLGGFCAFKGEDLENIAPDDFNAQKPWKRIIVLVMGATFNLIFGFLMCIIMLMAVGFDIPEVKAIEGQKIEININNKIETYYNPNYETDANGNLVYQTDENGNLIYEKDNNGDYILDNNGDKIPMPVSILHADDVILKINGKSLSILYGNNLNEEINKSNLDDVFLPKDKDGNNILDSNGDKVEMPVSSDYINLLVKRAGKEIDLQLKAYGMPRKNSEGVYIKNADGTLKLYPVVGLGAAAHKHTFGEAMTRFIPVGVGLAWQILHGLFDLITGQVALSNVTGPIGTIGFIASSTQAYAGILLVLIPLISINLGVFNLLPIPALAGARIVFVIIEAIRKKPIKRSIEAKIHMIGFICLFALVILLDVIRLLV
jgi:regulator of sigma E protease